MTSEVTQVPCLNHPDEIPLVDNNIDEHWLKLVERIDKIQSKILGKINERETLEQSPVPLSQEEKDRSLACTAAINLAILQKNSLVSEEYTLEQLVKLNISSEIPENILKQLETLDLNHLSLEGKWAIRKDLWKMNPQVRNVLIEKMRGKEPTADELKKLLCSSLKNPEFHDHCVKTTMREMGFDLTTSVRNIECATVKLDSPNGKVVLEQNGFVFPLQSKDVNEATPSALISEQFRKDCFTRLPSVSLQDQQRDERVTYVRSRDLDIKRPSDFSCNELLPFIQKLVQTQYDHLETVAGSMAKNSLAIAIEDLFTQTHSAFGFSLISFTLRELGYKTADGNFPAYSVSGATGNNPTKFRAIIVEKCLDGNRKFNGRKVLFEAHTGIEAEIINTENSKSEDFPISFHYFLTEDPEQAGELFIEAATTFDFVSLQKIKDALSPREMECNQSLKSSPMTDDVEAGEGNPFLLIGEVLPEAIDSSKYSSETSDKPFLPAVCGDESQHS